LHEDRYVASGPSLAASDRLIRSNFDGENPSVPHDLSGISAQASQRLP
jgi:hypothetical protein